ncbi:hypothetical protein H634G_02535 [Metarhizium anisopliae BRIP 53293]|uniref:Beta-lactamase-related domain-containing protein n=1 Tax=Metarhizium anisopliae BRIP 53293 TaxID=1291518 RepID=A0A0D9P8C5_METAN|nr:hypothetical protein H634G_02535 [Metarhizium anisopliae BRIP 53293]KJK89747.1 hypothetical protein H633G_06364 [Metarhizium anisopliae BRIP 53284]
MGFLRSPLLGMGLALNIACASHADALVPRRGTNHTSGQNLLTSEVADFVKEHMDFWKIPGMAIAVVDKDDIFTQGYGFSELPDKKVTPDTLFYGGSTTKAQTAACLSVLIKNGSYDALANGWATNISSILKDDFVLENKWATEHITLDDAVSHRSGLPRHDRALMREKNGVPLSTADLVRNLRNLPYIHEPRVASYYNNHMYVVLSHVIETVTKKGLKQVMRELLWNPLGMNSTYLGLADAQKAHKDLAKGYLWINQTDQINGTRQANQTGQFKPVTYMPMTDLSGSAAVISNVRDYAQWIRGLVNHTHIFSDDVHDDIRTARFIFSPAPQFGYDIDLYSLGWFRNVLKGHLFYRHDGVMLGFRSMVYWFPEEKFGFVIFANSDTAATANNIIARKLVAMKLNIPEKEVFNVTASREGITTPEQDFEVAVKKYYPNHTISDPSFSFKDMEGTYVNAGYGTMTLRSAPGPKNETVLIAERPDMSWDYTYTFRHIFGDKWISGLSWREERFNTGSFGPAEFIKGTDGKPAALKMTSMQGTTSEGDITYNKTG